jgi:hypothetical protein
MTLKMSKDVLEQHIERSAKLRRAIRSALVEIAQNDLGETSEEAMEQRADLVIRHISAAGYGFDDSKVEQ